MQVVPIKSQMEHTHDSCDITDVSRNQQQPIFDTKKQFDLNREVKLPETQDV